MDKCCGPKEKPKTSKLKIVLWVALILNFIMFVVEFSSSFAADSRSLKADSLDFLGDSANYVISLFVLGMSVKTKAKASLFKALTMGCLGLWVAVEIAVNSLTGASPNTQLMATLGIAGLFVNGFVTFILYQFREGDSNMQSVWLCSRNDALGNIGVIAAAFAVNYFGSHWPDLLVAALMAYLSISATIQIIKVSLEELKDVNSSTVGICNTIH